MTQVEIAAIIVAIVAALGAWAAQRSSAKASKFNTQVSGRLDAEKNAYERARAFDISTIERQNDEIRKLRDENRRLKDELSRIKARLSRLEHISPQIERMLHDRLDEPDDHE